MTKKHFTTPLTPELYCSDIQTSLDFYINLLGFTIQYQREDEGFAMLERQGARIMLDEISKNSLKSTKRTWISGELTAPFGRGINLEIKTTQIDDLYNRVQRSNAHIFLPIEERRYRANDRELYIRQFIVMDPDSYMLRFSQDIEEELMTTKKPLFKPKVVLATREDLPAIQRMWPFYVYDMGRDCGFNKGWECPTHPSFAPDDLTPYFDDPTRRAFLVKINDEQAGFILLNQAVTSPGTLWNIGEFYIHAKYQGKGVAIQVAEQILKMFAGTWEVSVTPENKRALAFWRKAISHITSGHFTEEVKAVGTNPAHPSRYLFSFSTNCN